MVASHMGLSPRRKLLNFRVGKFRKHINTLNETPMLIIPMFAAAGYSLIYLLMGGGLGGAILIFIVAKMFRK